MIPVGYPNREPLRKSDQAPCGISGEGGGHPGADPFHSPARVHAHRRPAHAPLDGGGDDVRVQALGLGAGLRVPGYEQERNANVGRAVDDEEEL